MLTTLRVRDLATIREVTLELGPGLNVLTGETGAGKSLLVDSLALLLGDRADRAVVRPGAARAIIEGTVEEIGHPVRQWLEANGLDPGETLVLRREVTAEGRSRAWINGSPATIGVLAALGELLVDLHGQHQTVQLLNAATQRALLDGFADATRQAEAVAVAFRTLADRQEELASLDRRREAAARQADWLRFVADEISSARLEPGEDARLEREALRLGQAGSLAELARRIVLAIDDEEGGARHALAQADRACQQLERLDPEVVAWRELLDPAFAQLAELAQRAAEYADGLAEDPDRLAEVERRRDLIQELKRKHGPTIEEVRAVGKRAAEELDLLDTSELDRRLLAAGVAGAERQLQEAAESLSAIRQDGAQRLAREVGRILPRLGLAGESSRCSSSRPERSAWTGPSRWRFSSG